MLSHFYQAFLLSYISHYNAKSSLILNLAYGIKTLGICTTITQTESTTATVQKNRNSTLYKQRQPRPGCGTDHARGGISRANHGQPVVKATAVVWYLYTKPIFQRQPRPPWWRPRQWLATRHHNSISRENHGQPVVVATAVVWNLGRNSATRNFKPKP